LTGKPAYLAEPIRKALEDAGGPVLAKLPAPNKDACQATIILPGSDN
jgi:hypothetical protein